MNPIKRLFLYLTLGVTTCFLLIGTASFAQSTVRSAVLNPVAMESVENDRAATLALPGHNWVAAQIQAELQEANLGTIAQTTADPSPRSYAAILTKGNVVVPNRPSTSAFGTAGAVLIGDRLIVRGDFSSLSSPLRDYATDPTNPPNPNITSGVHIHRGEPTQNGPFQYALTVTLNETGLGGRLAGQYTLTTEQLQALTDGKLYVDLHTQQNRAGELRGIFKPV